MMNFSVVNDIAMLHLDDGKANAVSHAYVDAMNAGLDRAEQEAAAVVITGREGVFSAGFDLKELQKGEAERTALVAKGAHMLLRLFTHPQPIVAASAGHAVAAGALVLLAADTRIGASGEAKYGLNETAIGMSLPPFGMELALCRLTKTAQTAAILQSTLYSPDGAQEVGYLDEVVAGEALLDRAMEQAAALAQLSGEAYAANKLNVRREHIVRIEASLGG